MPTDTEYEFKTHDWLFGSKKYADIRWPDSSIDENKIGTSANYDLLDDYAEGHAEEALRSGRIEDWALG
jgi:hypothetical protein